MIVYVIIPNDGLYNNINKPKLIPRSLLRGFWLFNDINVAKCVQVFLHTMYEVV